MTTLLPREPNVSVRQVEDWAALSSGAVMLLYGATTRSKAGIYVAAASAPLLYRGITGEWPLADSRRTSRRVTLTGERAIRVREAIQLELPIEEVYRFWRQLDNLPQFMSYLYSVTESPRGRSHWVAVGPGGVRVEWDAEIIREVENQVISWRSLQDSDVVTEGSVEFDRVRGGRATQVTVNLHYAPPAGRGGAAVAWLFGRAPSQTIREDLRRVKQLLEAGEPARATRERER
jgi:uncharacterized membrane protein